MEELRKTLNDYIESASGEGQGLESGGFTKTRRIIHLYNLYGRIITKKNKGCSYYYELLNLNTKTDGWSNTSLKLEVDFSEQNKGWQYENQS